jgi:hypothetical protein
MKKELGDLLSKAQMAAILQRRDKILQICAEPDPDWWPKVQENLGRERNAASAGI